MMADLCFKLNNLMREVVHMVVGLEGKASIADAIHELRRAGYEVIRVRPDEEALELEGVWRWDPLLPPIPSHHLWNGLITAEHYRGSTFIDWEFSQLVINLLAQGFFFLSNMIFDLPIFRRLA